MSTGRSCRITLRAACYLLTPCVSLLAFGCASNITAVGELTSPPSRGDAVVVVFSPETTVATGEEMVACVTDAIRSKLPHLRLIPTAEFLDIAFPGLAAEAAPLSRDSLALLLGDTTVRERLVSRGIRHLVLLGGRTTQSGSAAGECGGGAGAAACLFVWVGDRESLLTASIFDVQQVAPIGRVVAKVEGHPWFAIIGIFPLGMPSLTESWACHKLGDAVAKFLQGPKEATP